MIAKTNSQISDRKAEKASLESQVVSAQAEAQRLQSFADFASLQQAREATVTSLAQSRFDWERVLRELAIVIPNDVWLTDLSATASADSGASSTSTSSTDTIQGPSLEISGCAVSHEAVARFLAALRDIDGLTRATVFSSDRGGGDSSGSTGSTTSTSTSTSSGGASGGCSTRSFLATFDITAAFDNVVPAIATESTTATTATTAAPTTTTPTSASASSADQSQTSAPELQQQNDSAAQKTQKGNKAVNTFIPGTGTAP
jgi:hypothetical protein